MLEASILEAEGRQGQVGGPGADPGAARARGGSRLQGARPPPSSPPVVGNLRSSFVQTAEQSWAGLRGNKIGLFVLSSTMKVGNVKR